MRERENEMTLFLVHPEVDMIYLNAEGRHLTDEL